IRRHGSFRTTFIAINGRPMQRLSEDSEISFESEDASTWDAQELNQRLAAESNQSFDLERGPLIKMRTYTRSGQEHIVLMVAHHMVADIWSMAIVLRELGEVYSARLDSTEARLESCDLRYVDYADWQSRLLESQEGERLLSYWQKQLLGAPTAIDF